MEELKCDEGEMCNITALIDQTIPQRCDEIRCSEGYQLIVRRFVLERFVKPVFNSSKLFPAISKPGVKFFSVFLLNIHAELF